MSSRRSVALLAALAAGVLCVAGCGGGGGNGDGEGVSTAVTTSSLGKAAFIKQADAMCKKRQEAVRDEFFQYIKTLAGSSESESERRVHTEHVTRVILLPAMEGEVEDIRSLGAPKGDEAKVETLLTALEQGMEKAEADPGDAIAENSKFFARSQKLASEYGLEDCGGG